MSPTLHNSSFISVSRINMCFVWRNLGHCQECNCERIQGFLLQTQHFIQENRAISSLVGTSVSHVWLGLYCAASDPGYCYWSDDSGSAAFYSNFARSEPFLRDNGTHNSLRFPVHWCWKVRLLFSDRQFGRAVGQCGLQRRAEPVRVRTSDYPIRSVNMLYSTAFLSQITVLTTTTATATTPHSPSLTRWFPLAQLNKYVRTTEWLWSQSALQTRCDSSKPSQLQLRSLPLVFPSTGTCSRLSQPASGQLPQSTSSCARDKPVTTILRRWAPLCPRPPPRLTHRPATRHLWLQERSHPRISPMRTPTTSTAHTLSPLLASTRSSWSSQPSWPSHAATRSTCTMVTLWIVPFWKPWLETWTLRSASSPPETRSSLCLKLMEVLRTLGSLLTSFRLFDSIHLVRKALSQVPLSIWRFLVCLIYETIQ